jgi:site-specific DNA-cytosine methylase
LTLFNRNKIHQIVKALKEEENGRAVREIVRELDEIHYQSFINLSPIKYLEINILN